MGYFVTLYRSVVYKVTEVKFWAGLNWADDAGMHRVG